jgi:hypothetical protein
MVDLTVEDNVAISNAIWSHPQGVSYKNKLTQIAECCQNMGNKRSGVTRLWMYELYAKSIEEDHKKRGIGVKTVAPVVVKAAKQVKKQPRRRAAARVEQSTPYPSIAPRAPVFTRNAENESLIAEIDDVLDAITKSPLKLVSVSKPKAVVVSKAEVEKLIAHNVKQIAIKRKKKHEDEWLLLAA